MKHDDPRHRTPPRAEPLQPDRPGRGTQKQGGRGTETPAEGKQGGTTKGAENREEQAQTAIENTREGYGGG